MKFEEQDGNGKVSEASKLETKSKNNRFVQIVRGSNIYASLPNYRSSNANPKAKAKHGEYSSFTTNDTTEEKSNNNDKIKQQRFSELSTAAMQSAAESYDIETVHKKNPTYLNFGDDDADDVGGHSFGLSNDLSTESIKNACQFYDDDDGNLGEVNDDLSDDDLIETFHTPHSFQKAPSMRRSLRQQAVLTIDRHRKRCKLDEHPLCTLPRSSCLESPTDNACGPAQGKASQGSIVQDEVIDVLNELDAILNGHDASPIIQQNGALGPEVEKKIEACLLDLDNYLDGIDDDATSIIMNVDLAEVANGNNAVIEPLHQHKERLHRTLPKNLNVFPVVFQDNEDNGRRLSHGQKLRRALSTDMKTDRYNSVDATLLAANTPTSSCLLSTRSLERHGNFITEPLPLILPPALTDHNVPESPSCKNVNLNEAETDTKTSAEASVMESYLPRHTDLAQRIAMSSELRRCYSQNNVMAPHIPAASLPSPSEMLTTAHILQNILRVQSEAAAPAQSRPRQFGRRALDGNTGRVFTMHVDASDSNSCLIRTHDHALRPTSAPARAVQQSSGSERSSVASSRNASPVSLVSSSSSSDDSSSITTTTTLQGTPAQMQCANNDNTGGDVNAAISSCDTPLDPDNIQVLSQPGNNALWPHSYSRTLALISCSLGLFNICRFAILTVQFGGNFLLQFFLLSFIFGIPLLWLQMSLGAKIKAGPVTMWKISPICKGIGIALMLVQCILAIYSSIGMAWVLVYLRDSFLEKTRTQFPWQDPFFNQRHFATHNTRNLTETVADYFNGFVLRRLQFVSYSNVSTTSERFEVNDRQLAFNLALIWAAVFLVLCKGLKSYGKAVLALATAPLVALIVVTVKLLTLIDFATLQNIFSAADFEDFLINSKTWSAAAQETFLTWGLWGPSVIAISSRLHANVQSKDVLRRDAVLVVVTTLFGLSLAALLGLACLQILKENYFIYVPGSYEYMETYTSVYSLKGPINPALISIPTKWMPHYSSLLGEVYLRPTMDHAPHHESGYQALRLISELFPAAMALCSATVSWMWVAVAFGMFFLFGLAQMCAMWKPISSALGNSTSSVLLSCVTGLLLSIPFSTEIGIAEVYFMDLVMGGSWFLPILWTGLIFGVFLIRGRPYNGDDLVNDLRLSGSMSAFLALSWNVLLPIGLVTLAVVEYKTSDSYQLYHWRGKSYFSLWARKLAGLLQIVFMMIVPLTALFQILLYLTSGPPDILDRIQLLYRPPQTSVDARATRSANQRSNSNRNEFGFSHAHNAGAQTQQAPDDAPPKYTPPPSYTTATGARLAKLLRQSIRRSVRRLINSRVRAELPLSARDQTTLPPDYAVLHMSENIEIGQRLGPDDSTYEPQRALSLGRNVHPQKLNYLETVATQPRPRSHVTIANGHHLGGNRSFGRPYTAEDVATILRSSSRHANEQQRTSGAAPRDGVGYKDVGNCSSYSAENLILNAEPLGESAAIAAASLEQNEDDIRQRGAEESDGDGNGNGDDDNATVI